MIDATPSAVTVGDLVFVAAPAPIPRRCHVLCRIVGDRDGQLALSSPATTFPWGSPPVGATFWLTPCRLRGATPIPVTILTAAASPSLLLVAPLQEPVADLA